MLTEKKLGIQELLEKIKMPPEAAEQIAMRLDEADGFDVSGLCSMDTAEKAYESLKEQCGDDEILILAAFMSATMTTKENYIKKGIGLDIFYESMGFFARAVVECVERYGRTGFEASWWGWRQTSGALYRLGILEFEIVNLKKEGFGDAVPGETMISVHIPKDAPLIRSELDKSYDMAEEFFKKQGVSYKLTGCCSWLLSPNLSPLLPENSRILEFQKDYNIVSVDEDEPNFMEWIYKRKYENLEDLPEDTSLRRNAKRHLLSGGKLGVASGVLKRGES